MSDFGVTVAVHTLKTELRKKEPIVEAALAWADVQNADITVQGELKAADAALLRVCGEYLESGL